MTSKYDTFNVENPIEVSIDQGDSVLTTSLHQNIKKKQHGGGKGGTKSSAKRSNKGGGNKGRRSPSHTSDNRSGGDDELKSAAATNNFNFSRLKGQNVTGFTVDSVETGY